MKYKPEEYINSGFYGDGDRDVDMRNHKAGRMKEE